MKIYYIEPNLDALQTMLSAKYISIGATSISDDLKEFAESDERVARYRNGLLVKALNKYIASGMAMGFKEEFDANQ